MSGSALVTLGVVSAWFVLNVAMGSSTKWLYLHGNICRRTPDATAEAHCTSYRFPLAITIIHMGFSWATCGLYLRLIRGSTPGIGFSKQLRLVAPLALVFALSVAMGNLSLKFIFPSFNQMLGSMGPVITVILAIVIDGKRYNAWTWVSMPVLCGGLMVCSVKEANFHLLGGLFATGATILRAAKSIMQGSLLKSKEDKLDAVALLYYMAPWAAAVLVVLMAIIEGAEPVTILLEGLRSPTEIEGLGHVLMLLCLSGLNACLLNVFNFLVTFYTNAVWQQVLGNVKSCLAIATSVYVFGNELKPAQAVGVATCLFGVWMYNKWGGVVKTTAKAA